MSLPQEPSWLQESGVFIETYASVHGIGEQLKVSIENGSHPALFESEHEWLAYVFGVSQDIVKDWRSWVDDRLRCRAHGSSGQRCQCASQSFSVNPSEYDPSTTPYCKHHKDPAKRGIPRKAAGLSGKGVVYLLHATGTNRYKIGVTSDITKRLNTLRHQSPFPIDCLNCYPSDYIYQDESQWHEIFAGYRVHGEWFELPDSCVNTFMSFAESAKSQQEAA